MEETVGDNIQETRTAGRNPLVILLLLFLFMIGVAALGGLMYIFANHHTLEVIPAEFAETGEELSNPYCGWYNVYYYRLGYDENDINTVTAGYRGDKNRLALLEFDISKFRYGDISQGALFELQEIFRAWELSDKNLIVRFLYDVEGEVTGKEPRSLDKITYHMDQIAGIVNVHKDLIYIMQGDFAGNFGEMHGGTYSENSSMKLLMDHLAGVIDDSIFLAVRTPAKYRYVVSDLEPIKREEAYNGSLKSRISLFNDGMTGSETDLGTYAETPWGDNRKYETQGDRNQELAFQSELCRYVPNGGEAVVPNKYNDFLSAVSTFSTMHVSYLNSDYDEKVLKKWKNYKFEMGDAFSGDSGYDYIGKHLGYRFFVNDFKGELAGLFSNEATLSVFVDNTGFAGCYKPLDIEFTVLGSDNYTVAYSVHPDYDIRLMDTDANNEITISLPVDELGKGKYTAYIKFTDVTGGKTINLDNVNSVEGTYKESYGLYLGEFTIDEE